MAALAKRDQVLWSAVHLVMHIAGRSIWLWRADMMDSERDARDFRLIIEQVGVCDVPKLHGVTRVADDISVMNRAAFLTLPSCSLLDRRGDLLPIVWVVIV